MTTSYDETLTKFRKILDVQDDDLFVMLEEGRLAGTLIRTLMKKGMRATPSMKNSVEKAVKTLEKDTTARFDPETQPPPAQAPPVTGMDMLAGEMPIKIMFTDVVGSTPMNQRLGDQQARQVMRAHDALVRNHTKIHSGVEVKSMVDGFMITFPRSRARCQRASRCKKSLCPRNSPSGKRAWRFEWE